MHRHQLQRISWFPPLDQLVSLSLQVTFGMADSLFRSGTNHGHDEPPHLRLRNPGLPSVVNLPVYAGPESRYCPAGAATSSVYMLHSRGAG